MGLLSYLQRQKEFDAQEAARKQYQTLLGSRGERMLEPQAGPMQPAPPTTDAAPPPNFLPPIPAGPRTGGTGLLGGQVSPQEFLGRTAGMPGNLGPNTINAAQSGLFGQQPSQPFGGTGIDAQTYNKAISYNQKKKAGIKTTQAEDMAYNLSYQKLGRPQRFMNPNGQMVEYPGMDLTGFVTPPGMSKKGRKVIGKKPMAAESASKLAMIDTAKFGTELIEPILFKDEKINRDAIKGMWAINLAEPAAAFASEDSQKLFIAFEWGKQAITRTETGAAMPSTEVTNTAKRFMPKPWDGDDVVKLKWAAYNLFLNNTENYLDPDNLTADAIFNKAMADARKTQTGSTKPSIKPTKQKVVDWKDLP